MAAARPHQSFVCAFYIFSRVGCMIATQKCGDNVPAGCRLAYLTVAAPGLPQRRPTDTCAWLAAASPRSIAALSACQPSRKRWRASTPPTASSAPCSPRRCCSWRCVRAFRSPPPPRSTAASALPPNLHSTLRLPAAPGQTWQTPCLRSTRLAAAPAVPQASLPGALPTSSGGCAGGREVWGWQPGTQHLHACPPPSLPQPPPTRTHPGYLFRIRFQ